MGLRARCIKLFDFVYGSLSRAHFFSVCTTFAVTLKIPSDPSGCFQNLVKNGGGSKAKTTFREFVEASRKFSAAPNNNHSNAEHPYLFDRKLLAEIQSLNGDYSQPPFLSSLGWITQDGDSARDAPQSSKASSESFFSVGDTGSGTVLHHHFESFNVVVVGAKRWFIFNPEDGEPAVEYPPHRTIQTWIAEVYEPRLAGSGSLAPLECTVYPGEVVYLPAGWYHATVNQGETVSVSQQQRPSLNRAPPSEDELGLPVWLWYTQFLEAAFRGAVPATLDDAMAAAKVLVRLRPRSVEAWVLYARLLRDAGDFVSSLVAAREAIAAEPKASTGHFEVVRAVIQLFHQRTKAAGAIREQLYTTGANSAATMAGLRHGLFYTDLFEEAKASLNLVEDSIDSQHPALRGLKLKVEALVRKADVYDQLQVGATQHA
jgi:hypothetical protein